MIIDAHAHFLPAAARRAFRRGSGWHGITVTRDDQGRPVAERDGWRFQFGAGEHFEGMSRRVARMDAREVDTELLSLLPPLFGYGWPAAETAALARDVNDELSALAGQFGAAREPDQGHRPGRFLGLATLPLQDVPAAVAELDRAMALPGMAGVAIGTHVNGVNLDAAALRPFWQAAHAHRAFVLIHPIAPRDAGGALDRYYLRNVIGNPLETTIAAASLLLSGRLAELPAPELPVCLAHGGGYLPAAAGRLGHAYRVRPETAAGTGEPPRTQLRRFLYDTLTHDESGLRQLVDAVGADRVVLGTDFPADMGQPEAVAEIRASARFAAAEQAAMLGGNLAAILRDRLPAGAG